MKPDWKDAPEWANYLAMDKDGEWWWYENKPEMNQSSWWQFFGLAERANFPVIVWRDSLQERPIVVSADSVRYDYEQALSRTKRGDVL